MSFLYLHTRLTICFLNWQFALGCEPNRRPIHTGHEFPFALNWASEMPSRCVGIHSLHSGWISVHIWCEPALRCHLRPNSHRMQDTMCNATQANGTCCHQWECSHCTQATSKEKCSFLRAHRVARPVWIRPEHFWATRLNAEWPLWITMLSPLSLLTRAHCPWSKPRAVLTLISALVLRIDSLSTKR